MVGNVTGWCEKRKAEVNAGSQTKEEKDVEILKLDERIKKFKDKMSFMDDLKLINQRLV